MQPDEADFEISESPIVDWHPHTNLAIHRTRRHWRRAQSVTLLALLFALLVSQHSYIAAIINTTRHSPVRSAALPTQLKLAIFTNVSQGTLTVNGRAVSFSPSSSDQSLIVLKSHMIITWNAPPFQPITCTMDQLSLRMSATSSHCALIGSETVPALGMSLTTDDLPALPRQQFDVFFAKYLAQLDAIQSVVPVGDHYPTGTDASGAQTTAIASTPLHAEAWIAQSPVTSLDPATDCSRNGICSINIPHMPAAQGPAYVLFGFHAIIGWRFFDAAGHLIASYQPTMNEASGSAGLAFFPNAFAHVPLTYDPATGWSAWNADANSDTSETIDERQLASIHCQGAQALLTHLLQTKGVSNLTPAVAGQPTAAGCLIQAISDGKLPGNPGFNPLLDTSHDWFLSHCGALLAVNESAHALLPQLPRATYNEVNEVWHAAQLP